ncbi:MAG: CapA family protein [Coriobacteriales bacterium]|nr:CapA family protein [Coriobacteriales bacterium]
MTGRGIDQVLPHPSEPRIYEPFVRNALDYVELAERTNGTIPRPVDFDYVWGDALAELEARAPAWRIANLETSITTSLAVQPKGINYRMHPENVHVLHAARLDCCALGNNHVLDWGRAGLLETLDVLERERLTVAGAGRDAAEAALPAVLRGEGRGRVLVFSFGSPDSGVPFSWAADENRSGVALLPDHSPDTADQVVSRIVEHRRQTDVVVVSIHWGENWGYDVPVSHREFAHRLVDSGQVDVVHGHSSHHPKGIEVYRGRPIIFGCGDFINDYEGISGYQEYRAELVLGYFVTLAPGGELSSLVMAPFRLRRFRLERVTEGALAWLRRTMDRECERLGSGVVERDGALALSW